MRVGHSRWDIGAAASLAKAICAAVAVLIVPTVASAGAPPIHLELQWARPADPAGVVDRPWRNGIASGECAEFSRDGRYIATCSKGDGRMGKFHHGGGNSHSVNSVDLISDDRYLLSAGTNTDGGLWRIDTTRDPDGLITSVNLIRLATMTHPTSTTREIRLQPAAPLDTALVALTSEHDQATFVYRMGELLSHRLGAAAAGLALLAAAMRSVEPRPSSGTGEASIFPHAILAGRFIHLRSTSHGISPIIVSFRSGFAAAASTGPFEAADVLRLRADLTGTGQFDTIIAEFVPNAAGDLVMTGTGQVLTPTFTDFGIDLESGLAANFNHEIHFRLEVCTDDPLEAIGFDSLRVTGVACEGT